MDTFEYRVNGWLIPTLLSTSVGLLGWMNISINKISESLAVVTYRLETQVVDLRDTRAELKEVRAQVKLLETYARRR